MREVSKCGYRTLKKETGYYGHVWVDSSCVITCVYMPSQSTMTKLQVDRQNCYYLDALRINSIDWWHEHASCMHICYMRTFFGQKLVSSRGSLV